MKAPERRFRERRVGEGRMKGWAWQSLKVAMSNGDKENDSN